jgi:hypothetical protein
MRWVGIDEAGYGPNLGPLVMTAVVAELVSEGQRDRRELDFWGDLAATVDRAGGDPKRLWIDDSKAIHGGGKGRDRLETACLAAVHAANDEVPTNLKGLLEALGAGSLDDAELSLWNNWDGAEPSGPELSPRPALVPLLARQPLCPPCGSWRVSAVWSVVVGPAKFNAGLAVYRLKSDVHFLAFEALLRRVWERAADGIPTSVLGDKHGGRHYYFERLSRSFPDGWIDRGIESADSSRYVIRRDGRRVELRLAPRADSSDGLVALASIVSKTVRELWMDVFNSYWTARVPRLQPTAGYHTDAKRFRREIEEAAATQRCDPSVWWRSK